MVEERIIIEDNRRESSEEEKEVEEDLEKDPLEDTTLKKRPNQHKND